MKILPLSKNYAKDTKCDLCMFAIVDDYDYERAKHFNWHKFNCEHGFYAATWFPKPRRMLLHKFVLQSNRVEFNSVTIFRNGNTLDCRKENIYSPLKKEYVYSTRVKMTIEQKREYWRTYAKNKRNNDISFKIKDLTRGRIRSILKNKKTLLGIDVHKQFNDIVGCDVSFFKGYIKAMFREGMTWDNHGKVWHLDHIVPCAYYDMTQADQLRVCFNYTNYQPLYIKENLSKNKRKGTFNHKLNKINVLGVLPQP